MRFAMGSQFALAHRWRLVERSRGLSPQRARERALLGESFASGCRGEYVERPEDLEPALQRAKEAKGPTVVYVKADRDADLAVPQEFLMRFVEVYQCPQG
jgi:hypothetical protein